MGPGKKERRQQQKLRGKTASKITLQTPFRHVKKKKSNTCIHCSGGEKVDGIGRGVERKV